MSTMFRLDPSSASRVCPAQTASSLAWRACTARPVSWSIAVVSSLCPTTRPNSDPNPNPKVRGQRRQQPRLQKERVEGTYAMAREISILRAWLVGDRYHAREELSFDAHRHPNPSPKPLLQVAVTEAAVEQRHARELPAPLQLRTAGSYRPSSITLSPTLTPTLTLTLP